jgi:hypothetical protein
MNKGELEDFKIGKLSILLLRLRVKYLENQWDDKKKLKIEYQKSIEFKKRSGIAPLRPPTLASFRTWGI